jgi:endoglucanase
MNKETTGDLYLLILLTWMIFFSVCPGQKIHAQDVPFSRGVNLTGWFQGSNAEQIQFSKYTKLDFEQIKSLGCDVIRLPINLHYMTDGAPDYTIDPLFHSFLDEVVKWAGELNIHLILDNHTFDVKANTDPKVGDVLEKVWTQMALHYKDRSDYIYYEILNEPHGISDYIWNSIQQQVIDAIRTVDTKHYIVVGPANWNSYNNLDEMPVFSDQKLIYTFHFYDPFVFTHQGASWTDPSMAPLSGVPFPYQADSMPAFPASLEGTWIESAFNEYPTTGNIAQVKSLIDIAVKFKNTRNVPVFCGEFGVYIPNSSNYHRTIWYDTVRNYLEEQGIPWTIWDYHGAFGLFEEGSNGLFNHDLNVPLLQSLGLNVPDQSVYVQKPDSIGFMIYTDYIGSQVFESSYGKGKLNYYTEDEPNNGIYCISWTGADQYNTIGFDFIPDKDLSELLPEGYALDLMVRGYSPATSFDVRFLDTKTTDPDDHPWRMRVTVDTGMTVFDSRWHHLHIPLSLFTEHGAWDISWYSPEGKFDWKAIDRFEIVSEHQNLINKNLWFDNIHITNADTAQVYVNSIFSDLIPTNPVTGELSIFPNPVKDFLYVRGNPGEPLTIKLFDNLGRIWIMAEGEALEMLNVSFLPAGVYYLQAWQGNEISGIHKLLKMSSR